MKHQFQSKKIQNLGIPSHLDATLAWKDKIYFFKGNASFRKMNLFINTLFNAQEIYSGGSIHPRIRQWIGL